LAISGKDWQAVFHPPDKVEDQDVDPDVLRALPGIAYRVLITIEGNVPSTAHQRVAGLALKVARGAHGILYDPQDHAVKTPRGTKRFDSKRDSARSDTPGLTLSWWFEDDQAFAQDGIARLLDTTERHVAEALPRRYGLWEPPQFKYAEQGRAHLQAFLTDHLREPIVWYPNKPFTHTSLAIPPKVGASRQGYRCCQLRFEADGCMLNEPGWPLALRRFWTAVSQVVRPFFAEIRRGPPPIRSWFWTGIPRELGLAAIVGKPYTALWPDFVTHAKEIAADLFCIDVLEANQSLTLTPPKDLAQPPQPKPTQWNGVMSILKMRAFVDAPVVAYPKIWPFGPQFE
jgi:hypothetical protein